MHKFTEIEKKWCAGVPEIQEDGCWAMLDQLQAGNYLHISDFIDLTSKEFD